MINFNRCSCCFLTDSKYLYYTLFDQAHINTSWKNEALGSHPQAKMKIKSRHALKAFTKNNSEQTKKGSKLFTTHPLFFASPSMSVCVMVEVSKPIVNVVKEENNLALP